MFNNHTHRVTTRIYFILCFVSKINKEMRLTDSRVLIIIITTTTTTLGIVVSGLCEFETMGKDQTFRNPKNGEAFRIPTSSV